MATALNANDIVAHPIYVVFTYFTEHFLTYAINHGDALVDLFPDLAVENSFGEKDAYETFKIGDLPN